MKSLDYENVLVTGGAGFMGSNFIKTLLSKEFFQGKIINLDVLTYSGNLENLVEVQGDPRYAFIQGNILDAQLLSQVLDKHNITVIIHFAAESHVDRSIDSSRSFFETNVLGTLTLLEAIKNKTHIHFHHISTDEVYGETTLDKPFTESSNYLPNSPYAASKAASDHTVRSFGKTYGISTTISHSVNNFGPNQFPEKLIPLVISCLMKEAPIPVYGKGDQIRDWLYVQDHSEAVIAALKHGKKGQSYNFSAQRRVENLHLIQMVIDIFAKKQNLASAKYLDLITFVKDRPAHDFCYAVDASKACKDLQWIPRITLESGLDTVVEWYLKNHQWLKNIETGDYRHWLAKHYGQVGV